MRAREHLQPNETVVEWANGLCESTIFGNDTKRNGYVVATNKRVFIFVPKMFNNFEMEEFPFSTMSSIEYGKGMFGHSVKFIASGNRMKITMMNKGNPVALVEYVRTRIGKKEEPGWKCGCGHENTASWSFCGSCGKPKDAPSVLRPTSVRLVPLRDREARSGHAEPGGGPEVFGDPANIP